MCQGLPGQLDLVYGQDELVSTHGGVDRLDVNICRGQSIEHVGQFTRTRSDIHDEDILLFERYAERSEHLARLLRVIGDEANEPLSAAPHSRSYLDANPNVGKRCGHSGEAPRLVPHRELELPHRIASESHGNARAAGTASIGHLREMGQLT